LIVSTNARLFRADIRSESIWKKERSKMRTNVKAPLKNPVRRSSRREEAQIAKGSAIDQSLVTSAATIAFAAGLLLASAGSALAAARYVDVNSTNATPPYASWATAATNIQDAVDAAVAGDEIVVTNGIYAAGGRVVSGAANRVAVDKPLTLRSVNGPKFTTIDGGQSNRCVYLTNGASLSGFTLTNGVADYGAGVWCESANAVVSNCVVAGNSAPVRLYLGVSFPAGGGAYGGTLNNCILSENQVGGYDRWDREIGAGGGAFNATLNNCTLTGNSAWHSGGGAAWCMLKNCTLSGNHARFGGGAYYCPLNNCTLTGNSVSGPLSSGGGAVGCTLNNCIAYFNTAQQGANYDSYTTLNYSCTTPLPTSGVGNITSEPGFVDFVGGNLRLQPDSPCVNAGNSVFAIAGSDLDGHPRIAGGIVDIGAYEFQFNHAPFALANVSPLFALLLNETNRFILSPNNAAATVVLDGSQSSDADNDPLQFSWYADGQTSALASGALATNQFAVGPHTVQLLVSDGHDTATAQVCFEVITPATAVAQLMLLVDESGLGNRNKQPLLAVLSAGMSSFDRGNFHAALNQLSSFEHKVRAQVALWNPALASEFTAASQTISDVMSGR